MSKNCANCPGAAKCAAAETFLTSQIAVADDLGKREPDMMRWRGQMIDGFEGVGSAALPDHDEFDLFLSAEAVLQAQRKRLVLGKTAMEQAPEALAAVRTKQAMIEALRHQKACNSRTCMAETLGDEAIAAAMAGQRDTTDETTLYIGMPTAEIGD